MNAVQFDFEGGFLDGRIFSTNVEADLPRIKRWLIFTHGGQVGRRFREVIPEKSEELRSVVAPKFFQRLEAAKQNIDWQDQLARFSQLMDEQYEVYEVVSRLTSGEQTSICLCARESNIEIVG